MQQLRLYVDTKHDQAECILYDTISLAQCTVALLTKGDKTFQLPTEVYVCAQLLISIFGNINTIKFLATLPPSLQPSIFPYRCRLSHHCMHRG